MTLTREDFQKFAPRPKNERAGKLWDAYVDCFLENGEALAQEFGVDEPAEWWGLMGNIGHETGGFTVWAENLNYTTADRLLEVFGVGKASAAISPSEAHAYLGNPYELGERAYGINCPNPRFPASMGNTEPGDGFNCRGVGYLQTTGAGDHLKFFGRRDGKVSLDESLRAAFREWDEKKGNDLCRAGDFSKACRAVNGGTNGMKDRHAWHAKAKKVWPNLPFEHGAGDAVVETKPLIKSETMQAAAVAGSGGAMAAYEVVTMKVNEVAADASSSLLWKAWMLLGNVGVIGAVVTLFGVAMAVRHRWLDGDLTVFKTPS